jgi:hypothetical protein
MDQIDIERIDIHIPVGFGSFHFSQAIESALLCGRIPIKK